MSDKNFVLSVMPSATCKVVDSDYDEPVWMIMAKDRHEREYVVTHSMKGEHEAWHKIAETFRHKMISQLENAA